MYRKRYNFVNNRNTNEYFESLTSNFEKNIYIAESNIMQHIYEHVSMLPLQYNSQVKLYQHLFDRAKYGTYD